MQWRPGVGLDLQVDRPWRRAMRRRAPILLLALGGVALAETPRSDARRHAEIAAVTAFLRKAHAGTELPHEPAPLDGDEVRAAYGAKRRFYAVRASPPLPPGAAMRDLIEAHQRATQEWLSHHYLSAKVAIDERGRVSEITRDADYNAGLAPARNAGEVKRNAAAIFTLMEVGYRIGPPRIRADEVRLDKHDGGWAASVARSWNTAQIDLDDRGRLVRAHPLGPTPMPPSAPGHAAPPSGGVSPHRP